MQAYVKTMFMDWFVFDFVIFSFIDGYDDIFGDLEWFQVSICVKREGKTKTVRAENFRKIGQISGLNW